MVGEEQFRVHVQPRDIKLCIYVELNALKCVAHLEFMRLGITAQSFRLELHVQL